MRLEQLHLIRYGKFTDTCIELAHSDCDFHLLVGPNEAGKSTVRTAIGDLLFGMPRSSPLGFLHPQSELRLGAVIQGQHVPLAFHRTKSTKSPLRLPTDEPLPEDALARYLGPVDRSFFEQMFGLDHTQLVKGGQLVLDASNDVGQVLFQSTAGIAVLGQVRDGLIQEAAGLWAPRKSGERAYYIAAAQLEEAERELKEAMVRTRAWADARAALTTAEDKLEEVKKTRLALEANRAQLERIRRLSPSVQALRAKTDELNALGDVVELPPDASRTLSDGKTAQAVAEEGLRYYAKEVACLQTARDQLQRDDAMVSWQKDIEALEAFRHRVRDHAQDIMLRQREVDMLIKQVCASCTELGWVTDEDLVRAALPSSIALKTVDRLLKSHGALQQAQATAQKAVEDKRREIHRLECELGDTSDVVIADELRATLAQAQAFRNTAATQKELSSALAAAQHTLDDELAALGTWTRPVEALKTMALPSAERLTSLRNNRALMASDARAADTQARDAKRAADEAQLAVDQYEATNRIVTVDNVRAARERRNATWNSIKTGASSVAACAPTLDSEMELADQLVDTQLGSATVAAELQSLRHRVEREVANLSRLQSLRDQRVVELRGLDDAWATEASSLTLDGLMLDDAPAWLVRRAAAINAAATVAQKSSELEKEAAAADAALGVLAQQLHSAACPCNGVSLAAACAVAERFIRDSDTACARHHALAQQMETGQRALEGLQEDANVAQGNYRQWQAEWAQALSAAKLNMVGHTPENAEAALELVSRIKHDLDQAASIRRDRIETMTQDLEQFKQQACAIAKALHLADGLPGDVAQLSRQLGERLQRALNTQALWSRADEELSSAITKRGDAQLAVHAATARIAPLLAAAGVGSVEEVLPLVERSDARRQLLHAIDELKIALVKDADGLGLEAVLAEVDSADMVMLPAQLARVSDEQEQLHSQQTTAAEDRLRAQQSFDAISGSANAAIAEAKRQEALAAMVDASERYIKVATASRLLRWAIDKYRDRKQGPMLSRASTIFAGLTLGRYQKLFVNYEKEPLSLAAQRASGEAIEVPGMSEGTRDQLYLALRLAALELRAEQVAPLPFVADDLFINFDDSRAKAGLEALRVLSQSTQVIFLTHHEHLIPLVRQVMGPELNVIELPR